MKFAAPSIQPAFMPFTPVSAPLRRNRPALSAILTLALAGGAGVLPGASASAAEAVGAEGPALPQRVQVQGDGSAQRRADLAGRQVVRRAELLRHGDGRLVDALQRVPGLMVDGRGGNAELKLGGLGDGRTQVLLNGQPVPQGFSLDSVALDSIERVEITRGASVQSSQAITGTVNLVTRDASRLATRELKASAGTQWGQPQLSLSLGLGNRLGDTTWGLGLTASRERRRWPAVFVQVRDLANGTPPTRRTRTDKVEVDDTDALSLNPRWSWAHTEAGGRRWQIDTEHVMRQAVSSGGVADRRMPLLGEAPAQQTSNMALRYRRSFWQGRLQARIEDADGGRTALQLSNTWARRVQDAQLLGYDFTPALVQDNRVQGEATDQSLVLRLNHQRPLGDAHRLDAGVEWEQALRRESRVQVEVALPGGLPPENLDERFDAHVQRRAVYVQDDWSLSERTEFQIGLRLEQLRTDSQGNAFGAVRQSHRLVGPVLRVSLTPTGDAGTFKLGLSRGFRLSTPRDVMPRRYVPIEVSPTAPAMTGNPDLRPERAWSLDGSWQRAMPSWSGELVVSAALRRIDDVILDRLFQQASALSAPWLLQRFNGGSAWTASLELALRGRAADALVAAQPLQWRASLALNRSRLRNVAGADAALPGQPQWLLQLGLTQPLDAAWTAQLSLSARGASVSDQPDDRRLVYPARHSLDAGLTWRPQKGRSWRVSASHLLASAEADEKSVLVSESGVPVRYSAREVWRRDVLLKLAFEATF